MYIKSIVYVLIICVPLRRVLYFSVLLAAEVYFVGIDVSLCVLSTADDIRPGNMIDICECVLGKSK